MSDRKRELSRAALLLPAAVAMLAPLQEARATPMSPVINPPGAGFVSSLSAGGSWSYSASATSAGCVFVSWYGTSSTTTLATYSSTSNPALVPKYYSYTANFNCDTGLGGADHNKRLIYMRP